MSSLKQQRTTLSDIGQNYSIDKSDLNPIKIKTVDLFIYEKEF
jgi:hypothetical protein